LYVSIEYSLVALNLSTAELAGTIEEVTGVSVDPRAANYLQLLDQPQLEAIWKRFSEDVRWNKVRARGTARSGGNS